MPLVDSVFVIMPAMGHMPDLITEPAMQLLYENYIRIVFRRPLPNIN